MYSRTVLAVGFVNDAQSLLLRSLPGAAKSWTELIQCRLPRDPPRSQRHAPQLPESCPNGMSSLQLVSPAGGPVYPEAIFFSFLQDRKKAAISGSLEMGLRGERLGDGSQKESSASSGKVLGIPQIWNSQYLLMCL